MALRTIREMGDSVLEKKAKTIKDVTPRIRALAEDMLETMYESGGVGLAAPQVGILKRLVVIDITEERDEPYTMLNPEIIEQDGEQTGYEGCLSVPGKLGVVTRPNRVVVRYNDLDMNEWEMEAEDFLARAICHELDHLDGHLYVEKVEGELRDAAELEKEMEEEAEQAQEETEEA
ncbi:MAG: peptide deformylase [Eubacteriales bacterium]|nr:peptide deformylase [Eubacteriales bacterium]